jgi:hypothetical protein
MDRNWYDVAVRAEGWARSGRWATVALNRSPSEAMALMSELRRMGRTVRAIRL